MSAPSIQSTIAPGPEEWLIIGTWLNHATASGVATEGDLESSLRDLRRQLVLVSASPFLSAVHHRLSQRAGTPVIPEQISTWNSQPEMYTLEWFVGTVGDVAQIGRDESPKIEILVQMAHDWYLKKVLQNVQPGIRIAEIVKKYDYTQNDQIFDDFDRGGVYDVLILQYQMEAHHSKKIYHNCSSALLYDYPLRLTDETRAIGAVHRIGQTHQVECITAFLARTIDGHIRHNLDIHKQYGYPTFDARYKYATDVTQILNDEGLITEQGGMVKATLGDVKRKKVITRILQMTCHGKEN